MEHLREYAKMIIGNMWGVHTPVTVSLANVLRRVEYFSPGHTTSTTRYWNIERSRPPAVMTRCTVLHWGLNRTLHTKLA